MELPTFPRHSDCRRCELAGVARSVGIPTIHLNTSRPPSPTTPAVLFIGQNPGAKEDLTGEPFVGDSGDLLRFGYIEGAHLDRHAAVYITNTVRCHTLANAKPKWKAHVKPCYDHTATDIDYILNICPRSKVAVVCVGAPATEAFFAHVINGKRLNQAAAFHLNGHTFTCPTYRNASLTHFSTYHPAAIMRSPKLKDVVHYHMAMVQSWLHDVPRPDPEPTIIPPRRLA